MLINALLLGVSLSLLLGYADAAPRLSSRSPSPLVRRYNTFVGCEDEDRRRKVGKALADMANLALHAYSGASTSSLGYTHYFKDDELNVFKIAMSTISSNNDPTNPMYTFVVNCNPTGNVLKDCGKKSYAITDTSVPKDDNDFKSIWICPLFWTGPDTKQDLPNTNDKEKLDAFCKQDNYKNFVTAGHVLLHEITHLDAVAKRFPLDPDNEGRHGTLDYEIGSSPIQDARRLKSRIDGGQTKLQAPAYTAESYAGAATELWVQKFCNKQYVPPEKGW